MREKKKLQVSVAEGNDHTKTLCHSLMMHPSILTSKCGCHTKLV